MLVSGLACWALVFANSEPISLAETDLSYREVCETLSEVSGESYSADSFYSLDRIAIYCDNVALSELKRAVADFGGGVWVKTDGGWQLRPSSETVTARNVRQRESRAEKDKWLTSVLTYLDWLKKHPESAKEIWEGLAEYPGEMPEGVSARYHSHLGEPLSKLGSDVSLTGWKKDLLDGKLVRLRPSEVSENNMGVMLQFDPFLKVIQVGVTSQMTLNEGEPPITVTPPWTIRASHSGKSELPSLKEFNFAGVSEEVGKSEYTSGLVGLSEHALNIGKSLKVPVIADAYRRGVTSDQGFGKLSAESYLTRLLSESTKLQRAKVDKPKLSQGWLYLTLQDRDEYKQIEPPKKNVLAMEEIVVKGGRFPRLDEYGKFVAGLGAKYWKAFRPDYSPLYRFPIDPFFTGYFYLGLYGSLSESQRQQLSKDGLVLQQLTPLQIEMIDHTFNNMLTMAVARPGVEEVLGSPEYARIWKFKMADGIRRPIEEFRTVPPNYAFVKPSQFEFGYQIDLTAGSTGLFGFWLKIPIAEEAKTGR